MAWYEKWANFEREKNNHVCHTLSQSCVYVVVCVCSNLNEHTYIEKLILLTSCCDHIHSIRHSMKIPFHFFHTHIQSIQLWRHKIDSFLYRCVCVCSYFESFLVFSLFRMRARARCHSNKSKCNLFEAYRHYFAFHWIVHNKAIKVFFVDIIMYG